MHHYDLLVIGAGPAGSSAAAAAAGAGLKVALIERQKLPRHKTCGGGMPMVVGDFLRDLVPAAFLEADVRYMRHTWNFAEPHLAPINPGAAEKTLSLWMVRRSVFDNALAQRAAGAGADVLDGVAIQALWTDGPLVAVRGVDAGSGTEIRATASHVIGADGANGVTARSAGLRDSRVLAIAMEVEHPHRWGDGHPDLRRDVLHLEYGAVPRGYAWVFPKFDHLNVGAGVFRPRSADGRGEPRLRQELQRAVYGYMDALSIPYEPAVMRFHAHPVPLWSGRQPLQTRDGRVLLVGDAAGLVNPVFGDGILNAVLSGILAAECVSAGAACDYTARLHSELGANLDAALRLSRLFYRWTRLVYRAAITRPEATRVAARLLCGDALFTDVAGRAVRRLRGPRRS